MQRIRSIPVKAPGSGDGAARRALVVESDPGTRELCRRALQDQGFAVDVREGGVAALAAARANPPAVILLDLQLHDVEGLQFVAWLRSDAALESIPVIAISATTEDAARSPRKAFSTLLRTPLSSALLAQAIKEIVAARR